VYAGPFQERTGRDSVPFPWERLTGEALVYASLGTVVNGIEDLYRIIIEAMSNIPSVQLVLSVGKNVSVEALGKLPPHTIAVQSAPQLALLKKAALCITHAGLNTTLEAITHGVPMVAIPIAFDQPGVAVRIKLHGLGESVEPANLTVDTVEHAVRTVLETPAYLDRTRRMQRAVLQTDGLDGAADTIVRVLKP
jgi:zeaxanthin glucosyltransferase